MSQAPQEQGRAWCLRHSEGMDGSNALCLLFTNMIFSNKANNSNDQKRHGDSEISFIELSIYNHAREKIYRTNKKNVS